MAMEGINQGLIYEEGGSICENAKEVSAFWCKLPIIESVMNL